MTEQPTVAAEPERIGGGRVLTICDRCNQIDDHPKHKHDGGPNAFPNENADARVMSVLVTPSLTKEEQAFVIAQINDTSDRTMHMDCCAQDCPDGTCRRFEGEGLRGETLLAQIQTEGPTEPQVIEVPAVPVETPEA
jgi:hypothetical protein